MTVLLFPFQFGCFLFLLLVQGLWPGLLVLCWNNSGESKSGHQSHLPGGGTAGTSVQVANVMESRMSWSLMANIPMWPEEVPMREVEPSGHQRRMAGGPWSPPPDFPAICVSMSCWITQLLKCDFEHFGVNKTQDKIFLKKKKSGKSRHPCLVPDLKGNAFSFCPLSVMLAVGLSYMALIMLRYVASSPTLLRVLSWLGAGLYQFVFLHLFIWSCDFYCVYVIISC